MKSRLFRMTAVAAALASAPLLAQTAVYPSKGQTPQQQQKDQQECSAWATQTTGVDPAQIANQQTGTQGQGSAVKGAAGGAAGGAAIGAITGNAGKGAAIGAATGGAAGAGKRRGEQKQAQEQQQASMTAYNNARTACLTGRGYSVK